MAIAGSASRRSRGYQQGRHREIAPERDLGALDDIDSFDFPNLVIAPHERTGVEVPERDYPKHTTLNGCIAYLGGARKEQLQ